MKIDFGGAPFYLERIELVQPEAIELADYVGRYYSDELEVEYTIGVENGELILSYPFNDHVKLVPRQTDTWGNQSRTRYSFIRDKNREVKSFNLSREGTISNIVFNKI